MPDFELGPALNYDPFSPYHGVPKHERGTGYLDLRSKKQKDEEEGYELGPALEYDPFKPKKADSSERWAAIQKPEGTPGLPTLAARGVASGSLRVGESVGTGLRYLSHRSGLTPTSFMLDALLGPPPQTAFHETMEAVGEKVEDFFGKAAEKFAPPEYLQKLNVWDNPGLLKTPEWWFYNVGDMLPSLAASYLPGLGAYKTIQIAGRAYGLTPAVVTGLARLGASVAGGVAGGWLEGAQTYKQVLKEGGSEQEAARAAEFMGLGVGLLNAVSNFQIFEGVGKSFLAKVAHAGKSGLLEGVTEGLEEPWEVSSILLSKVLMGKPLPEGIGDMYIESLKDMITVAPIAAVTGVGAGVAGQLGTREKKDQEDDKGKPGAEGEKELTPGVKEPPAQDVIAAKLEADYKNGDLLPKDVALIIKNFPKGSPVRLKGEAILRGYVQLKAEQPIELGEPLTEGKLLTQEEQKEKDAFTSKMADQRLGAIVRPLAEKSAQESAAVFEHDLARRQAEDEALHDEARLPQGKDLLNQRMLEEEQRSRIEGVGGLAPYIHALLQETVSGEPGRRMRVKDADGAEQWFGVGSTYPEFMRNQYGRDEVINAIEKGLAGYEFPERESRQRQIWEDVLGVSRESLRRDTIEYAKIIEEDPSEIADVDDFTYNQLLKELRNEGYSTRAIQEAAERHRGPIQARAIAEASRRTGIPEEEILRAAATGQISLDGIWAEATQTEEERGELYDTQKERWFPRLVREGEEPGRSIQEPGRGREEAEGGRALQEKEIEPEYLPDDLLQKAVDMGPDGFLKSLTKDDVEMMFWANLEEPFDLDYLKGVARARGIRPAEAPTMEAPAEPPGPGLVDDIDLAAQEADTEPSPAQIEAGNYQKGHIKLHGLDVSIETPKGEKRVGYDVPLAEHYGYIRRTEGADGDKVDAFIGPNPESNKVFIINQRKVTKTGSSFDEHKVMIGFEKKGDAIKAYMLSYPRGWKGFGSIVEMSVDGLKDWLKNGNKNEPAVVGHKLEFLKEARSREDLDRIYQQSKAALERAPTLKDADRKRLFAELEEAYKIEAAKYKAEERRKDAEKRKRVEEMSPEEMRKELLTDPLTGLGNKRAYEEDPRLPIQVFVDVDSLKWVNDNISHQAGDELLKAVGQAFRGPRYRAYHISGDEFIIEAPTVEAANDYIESALQYLDKLTFEYALPDGTTITKKGAGISYGISTTVELAEAELQRHKAEREARGLRAARGEAPPGVVRKPPERGEPEGKKAAIAKKDEPIISDAVKTSLSNITVMATAIREATGEKIKVETNAQEALNDIDSKLKIYEAMLECLAS